jgi:hypothetical protein
MRQSPEQKRQRGQAHTLEAVVGGILLLTAVAIALQLTVVTPLSASTSSQHVEGQQRAVAEGVLANAVEDNSLKEAVLYWNDSANNFHDASSRGFYTEQPPDVLELEGILAGAFDSQGIAYNINFVYQSSDGNINSKEFVRQGTPSDNAVSATRTITIRNDDHLINRDGSVNKTATVRDSDTFFINNAPTETAGRSDGHGLYNVVRVEVIAWRI